MALQTEKQETLTSVALVAVLLSVNKVCLPIHTKISLSQSNI